jgi:hypothetical protein
MNLTHYKPRILEKRVETLEGVFLARFVVIYENHSLKLKLLEMIPLEEQSFSTPIIFQIAAPKTYQIYAEIKILTDKIVSPFTELLFFISQQTRAPSAIK